MAPLRQIARQTLLPHRQVELLTMIEYVAIPEKIALRFDPGVVPLVVRQFALKRRLDVGRYLCAYPVPGADKIGSNVPSSSPSEGLSIFAKSVSRCGKHMRLSHSAPVKTLNIMRTGHGMNSNSWAMISAMILPMSRTRSSRHRPAYPCPWGA